MKSLPIDVSPMRWSEVANGAPVPTCHRSKQTLQQLLLASANASLALICVFVRRLIGVIIGTAPLFPLWHKLRRGHVFVSRSLPPRISCGMLPPSLGSIWRRADTVTAQSPHPPRGRVLRTMRSKEFELSELTNRICFIWPCAHVHINTRVPNSTNSQYSKTPNQYNELQ